VKRSFELSMTERYMSGVGSEIYLRPLKLRALSDLKLSENYRSAFRNASLLTPGLVKLLTLAWMTVSLVGG
jgi:hypothetical protein